MFKLFFCLVNFRVNYRLTLPKGWSRGFERLRSKEKMFHLFLNPLNCVTLLVSCRKKVQISRSSLKYAFLIIELILKVTVSIAKVFALVNRKG